MNGELLLDTNAMIAFMAGEKSVRGLVADSPRLLLSITVLGELYYGARNSGRVQYNLMRVDQLASTSDVLLYDARSAQEYGLIKNELRLKGRPIPESDIWIAALARQHGLTLISRDKHFDEVEGLARKEWT